jgi:hypothetical protein
MIAQRMRHAGTVEIRDQEGRTVRHTRELISHLFDEELERLLQENAASEEGNAAILREARWISEEMIHAQEFDPA